MILFTYGTLKTNQRNNGVLRNSQKLGEFKTEPKYTMYNISGLYPAVVEGGTTPITGELYNITNFMVMKYTFELFGFTGTKGDIKNYFDITDITTPHGIAKMLVLKNHQKRKIIKDGIW